LANGKERRWRYALVEQKNIQQKNKEQKKEIRTAEQTNKEFRMSK
jgi:hypothetical protein